MTIAKGIKLSRYRASNLMKLLGLVDCQSPKHRYKKCVTAHVEIPNYLVHQFAVAEPNPVWVGDVTYIWSGNR